MNFTVSEKKQQEEISSKQIIVVRVARPGFAYYRLRLKTTTAMMCFIHVHDVCGINLYTCTFAYFSIQTCYRFSLESPRLVPTTDGLIEKYMYFFCRTNDQFSIYDFSSNLCVKYAS